MVFGEWSVWRHVKKNKTANSHYYTNTSLAYLHLDCHRFMVKRSSKKDTEVTFQQSPLHEIM